MSLLNKTIQRRSLVIFSVMYPRDIEQEYEKPARLLLDGKYVQTACMGCYDQPCIRFSEDEINCPEFPDFSYERDFSVCPIKAIRWNYESDAPEIDNTACIGCGICAARCPVGAIYYNGHNVGVSRRRDERYTRRVVYSPAAIERQKKQLDVVKKIAWRHQFRKESMEAMADIYGVLSRVDGRSMVPNLIVRNLLICLGYKCAISRSGDVYTRMDAVYSGKADWNKTLGVVEVEFGRDTLDASRGILDDIAVLHSRSHIDKNTNSALVVCLSFPNKRQGYFQVIKDIKNVLGLEIQTLSLGALILFVWNSTIINLEKREFYTDFDKMSIREAVENRMARKVLIPYGYLGLLEPEK